MSRRLARPRALWLVLLVALALVGGGEARAQGRRGVELRLPEASALASEGPLVRVTSVLDDRDLRDLLDHGFPIRVHYRAELWSAQGWFDDLRGSWEWDLVLRQDPLRKSYQVVRLVGDQVTPLGEFTQLAAAVAAAERPYRVPLVPRRGRRQYWNVAVDVETLSVSDLDEVERWLRGELRPAVRGERNPGTALGRGLRTLGVRLLGGEARRYEVRSETFRP